MDNCKRIDAQLELPEPIIQHIQSFLNGKESAATAVLSKSWYNSWRTHPNLDFDGSHLQSQQSVSRFVNFVKGTVDRYRDSNLNVESFKLCMDVYKIESRSRINELIVKVMKMGVNSVRIEFDPRIYTSLPNELLRAESLVDLSAVGCGIDNAEVRCVRLKSISLHKVCINDDTVRDIISGCPLIESLFLCDFLGLTKVDVSTMVSNLGRLSIVQQGSVMVGFLVEFPQQFVFRKLTHLWLEAVNFDTMLFDDFSKKFPCVRDLTLRSCIRSDTFDISSLSLESISLGVYKRMEIRLDVPNLRKFNFSGSVDSPSLSLTTASKVWESDLHFTTYYGGLTASWFNELNGFLTSLSSSKISLAIDLYRPKDRVKLRMQDVP